MCTPGGGLCVMGSNRFLLGNQSGKLIGNTCFLSKIPQQQQNYYPLPSKVNVTKFLSFGYVLCCVYSAVSVCNSMDCSWPGSSVHGILQTRILRWVAISYSRRGSSVPRDQTQVSFVVGRFCTIWTIRESLLGFESERKWKSKSLSHVWLFVIPWTV